MNASEHVGEFAALYALGILDESTRDAVDRHVGSCASCARLIASAQDDVATMVAAGPSHDPPVALVAPATALAAPHVSVRGARAPWTAWGALAAALLVGLLPTAYFWQQNRAMHATMASHAEAIERLASAPVRTAVFTPMGGGTTAHVMYPADGSWYVVLVRGASKALDVVWMHDGQRTMLGTTQPYGDVAMLYLPKSHRMDQLALLEGQRIVAHAQLAY